jgi:hypothetical protein
MLYEATELTDELRRPTRFAVFQLPVMKCDPRSPLQPTFERPLEELYTLRSRFRLGVPLARGLFIHNGKRCGHRGRHDVLFEV